MARLFAAHFTEKLIPEPVSGAYDPEQELWMGDNQLRGHTVYSTGTKTTKGTLHNSGGGIADRDVTGDSDVDQGTDA